jgi:integrase/recombinase XerD
MADLDRTSSLAETETDIALIDAFVAGRPVPTVRAYRSAMLRLRETCAPTPLSAVTLTDLRNHMDTLAPFAPRTRALAASVIKAFYNFHCFAGTLETDPSIHLRVPRVPSDLTDRILTEDDTKRLLAGAELTERVMLTLLYLAGLRAAELCRLTWGAVVEVPGGAKLSVMGKGQKPRTVLIPDGIFGDLMAMRPDDAPDEAPVFTSISDTSRPMGPRHLLRIVKRAAAAAGLSDKVSSHWLRHCHASHALDAGAPITLVRDSLGHSSISVTNRYAHARPNDGSARFLRTGG